MGLGLIVGIAALGVISARAVVERRQQIGILRALGFRRGMIQLSFLIESSFIALTAIVVGTLLALIVAVNVIEDTASQSSWADIAIVVPWVNWRSSSPRSTRPRCSPPWAQPSGRRGSTRPKRSGTSSGGRPSRMRFSTLIVKNLVRQRVRTALTVLGIGVGITTVVALGAITGGLKATASDLMRIGGADFMIAQKGLGPVLQHDRGGGAGASP